MELEKVLNLVKYLTRIQATVLNLYLCGFPQTKIARILGKNQSSITKSLFGNKSYYENTKDLSPKYGGSISKLKKLYKKHYPKVIEIPKPKKRRRRNQRPKIKPCKVINLREYRKLYKTNV